MWWRCCAVGISFLYFASSTAQKCVHHSLTLMHGRTKGQNELLRFYNISLSRQLFSSQTAQVTQVPSLDTDSKPANCKIKINKFIELNSLINKDDRITTFCLSTIYSSVLMNARLLIGLVTFLFCVPCIANLQKCECRNYCKKNKFLLVLNIQIVVRAKYYFVKRTNNGSTWNNLPYLF